MEGAWYTVQLPFLPPSFLPVAQNNEKGNTLVREAVVEIGCAVNDPLFRGARLSCSKKCPSIYPASHINPFLYTAERERKEQGQKIAEGNSPKVNETLGLNLTLFQNLSAFLPSP